MPSLHAVLLPPAVRLRLVCPFSHSQFGSHPTLIPEISPVLFHTLTWNLFCNSFVFTFMHRMGGCTPLSRHSGTRHSSLATTLKLFLFTPLRTLLHLFALLQISTLFFSIDSALFAKNHPGWGEGCFLLTSHGTDPAATGKLSFFLGSGITSHKSRIASHSSPQVVSCG